MVQEEAIKDAILRSKRDGMENDRIHVLRGTIASRSCPLCGHHEIGLVTKDGEFHVLKQGMEVQVHAPSGIPPFLWGEPDSPPGKDSPQENSEPSVPWVPGPMLSKKRLRMKYAVRIEANHGAMSPETYRLAYLDKIERLIDKEIFIPIPVILDRYFTAPNLASGNPRQIAEAMWKELAEIREPARRVEEWLITGKTSAFAGELEREEVKEELPVNQGEEEALLKELEDLTIEDFLALL